MHSVQVSDDAQDHVDERIWQLRPVPSHRSHAHAKAAARAGGGCHGQHGSRRSTGAGGDSDTMAPAVDPPEAIPMPAMASVHSFHPPGAHLHRDAVNAEVDSDAIAGGLAVFQTISPRTQHEHESS